ncbi:hypothetical protein [Sagittula salina]|uniref:Uncharacterized protein n=1 Tax=Sagittula salina TaxID=2820268 RepID=A0A940S1A3_9RHOB|nr:hypothetical protein [Sagittula salina]MBP0482852.1 hypothetical protein [Sagittula salina]
MIRDRNPIRRGDDGRIRHIDVPALMQSPDGFARLRSALEELGERLPDREIHDEPPWLIAPETSRDCVLWKVRRGAAALRGFTDWYRTQAPDRRRCFRERYPEPRNWAGFYDSLA